ALSAPPAACAADGRFERLGLGTNTGRGEPYHRIAYEAIRDRDPSAARAAIRAHLSVTESTWGDDYDRSLDSTAARALQLIGPGTGLEEFLRTVVPGEPRP